MAFAKIDELTTTRVCDTMQSLSKIIKNARGQMAIFIALIFQVLFLFFAMAINIGLAVHDKINLQNATDLAAYYAAQKQAEILDAIAHTNYQIRQAYKVLNFRYYYLGTLGYNDAPSRSNTQYGEVPYSEMIGSLAPTPVCIAYGPMWYQSSGDNICKEHNYVVPNITIPPIIAAFIPSTIVFQSVATQMQQQLIDTCQKYAAYNWFFAATMYVAYDMEQASRKQVIHALAQNLMKPINASANSMIDMQGQSIYEGAYKTFIKNLTYRNLASLSANPLTLYNSLQTTTSVSQWLPDIDVFFTIRYQDIHGTTGSCTGVDENVQTLPSGGVTQLYSVFPPNYVQNLMAYTNAIRGLEAGDPNRLSLGVEKNPWYLVYVGAKSSSTPTQLFSPFSGTTFTARAFAQPFGGRIGPWYSQTWPSGSATSNPQSLLTEPMAPPRIDWIANNPSLPIMPGYSRYPGDTLGETAMSYLQSLNQLADTGAVTANFSEYGAILSSMGPGTANDTLAYNSLNPALPSQVRNYEIAAAAPDLFDITYYSIQPGFGYRYLPSLISNAAAFGIPSTVVPHGDLGSRAGDPNPRAVAFSVVDQIGEALFGNNGNAPYHNSKSFWYVVSPAHLLTGWVTGDDYADYSVASASARLGQCPPQYAGAATNPRPPGDCLSEGGRVGYSVKLISPSMFSESLPSLGGNGQNGPILNPPQNF
jgi:Putative Flp pilus-assembly TadE/G-like